MLLQDFVLTSFAVLSDMRYFTEENFVQMFRISQLIIEYLLYVQNYLDSKKKSMEQDVQVILSDLDKCRNLLNQKVFSLRGISPLYVDICTG